MLSQYKKRKDDLNILIEHLSEKLVVSPTRNDFLEWMRMAGEVAAIDDMLRVSELSSDMRRRVVRLWAELAVSKTNLEGKDLSDAFIEGMARVKWPEAPVQETPAPAAPLSHAPSRILYLEDNQGDFELMKSALVEIKADAVIEHARTGEQALAYLNKTHPHENAERPDLVLLDLNPPLVGGMRALGAMRSTPELASIPAMMLTSSTSQRDKDQAKAIGAIDFMTKPFSWDDYILLAKAIMGYLKDRQ